MGSLMLMPTGMSMNGEADADAEGEDENVDGRIIQ